MFFFFFFQAEDGIRDYKVTGVQTCALPILTHFAFGLVLSIYIHEMGHVQALQRYGIKATAPMFIPGFGAVIRLKQYPADAREDARVGLAGPLWGLGAALAAYAVYRATGVGVWGAIAHMGALVNLFNLVPVWQLDGARGCLPRGLHLRG